MKTTIIASAVAALGATMMLPAHSEPPLPQWSSSDGHRGAEMRLVADRQYGEIVRIERLPAQDYRSVYVPNFGSGPRIIHVQPHHRARASVSTDEPPEDELQDDTGQDLSTAPRRRVGPPAVHRDVQQQREKRNAKPRWDKDRFKQTALPSRTPQTPSGRDLSVVPPQPMPIPPTDVTPDEIEDILPKRNVLSAPPLAAEGPSPIKPTPRWRIGERHEPTEEPASLPPEIEKNPEPTIGVPANVPLPPVMMVPPTSELLPPE